MSGVSAQEYRFSSKAATQLASLACCRCVQITCAAKNVWGNTCELNFILQACQYIKNLKKLGIKAMFFHQPGTVKQPGWAVVLHSSQPHPEQQFSWEGVFPLSSHQLLEDKRGFPWSGMDGPTPHQFFWLPACPRWGGPSFQRSLMKYESRERFEFMLLDPWWDALTTLPYSKDTYWINLNNEWMKETVIWSVRKKRLSLSN